MLLRSYFFPVLLVLSFTMVGCAGPKVSKAPGVNSMVAPIRVESADLGVALIGIAAQGTEGTLIEDPGWLEYVLEIKNLSIKAFTIQNVKLLNYNGRYVDSASAYEQIMSPPDIGIEVAGDVAETVAGIAAGQFIPYGGTLFSLISNAASATSGGAQANAARVFMSRVLKNVELAPAGQVEGSAYLPNITRPKTLVVDYTQDGMTTSRLQIPLPDQRP